MITARRTGPRSTASARALSARRIIAEISGGEYVCSPMVTRSPEPISRLIDFTVRSG